MADENFNLILEGLSKGDQIGGPTQLAKILCESTKSCKSFDLNLLSIGYDPYSNLKDVPSNPKKRYKVMTKEMPKNGQLSLEMMYQTAGTQINLDYQADSLGY